MKPTSSACKELCFLSKSFFWGKAHFFCVCRFLGNFYLDFYHGPMLFGPWSWRHHIWEISPRAENDPIKLLYFVLKFYGRFFQERKKSAIKLKKSNLIGSFSTLGESCHMQVSKSAYNWTDSDKHVWNSITTVSSYRHCCNFSVSFQFSQRRYRGQKISDGARSKTTWQLQ